MIATDALIIIALCLAVLAAIGVRNALSLRDIGLSLEKVAAALESSRSNPASSAAPPSPGPAGPEEAEIAAAIAAAAKAVGRGG